MMSFPVIKKAAYVLVNTPDMVIHNGTTQTLEKETNPDSEYLKEIGKHLRSFDEVVAYAPNQTYIGAMTPDELAAIPRPWNASKVKNAKRFAEFGEIMPEDEFYGLIKVSDVFDLVLLEKDFTEKVRSKFTSHPVLNLKADGLKAGEELQTIEDFVKGGAEGM